MMRQPRTGSRIPVQLPIEVRWKSHRGDYRQVHGKTGNISGNGLLMAVPIRLSRATPISMTVTLPAEVTHSRLELLCQGRVVRWIRTGKALRIAAIIDEYELRPAHRPV